MPAEDYHADPCVEPSLSASIATIICNRTPMHAFAAHPRLNPDVRRAEKKEYDIGTAAHAILLEQRPLVDVVEVIDAKDFRTKAAQEQRDAARAAGRVPLLERQATDVVEMLEETTKQLGAHEADPPLFHEGKAEQTIIWQENGITCRALVDWLRDDFTAIDDYKTTSADANPEKWTSKTLYSIGADVQIAFHCRGVEAISGIKPELRYVVQETYPPYALSVISASPDVLHVGNAKVEYAIRRWRECLEAGEWPGYPTEVCYAELPAWQDDPKWLVD